MFVKNAGLSPHWVAVRAIPDPDIVADRVATCGGEAWLAESRGVHREKGGGLRFVEFEELVHPSSGGRCGFQLGARACGVRLKTFVGKPRHFVAVAS